MALYLLSYDIAEKNHDYESLWDFLEAQGAKRILLSEWAVPWANDSSALELVNAVSKHIEEGDRLLACELFESSTVAWLSLKIRSDDFRSMLKEWARIGT